MRWSPGYKDMAGQTGVEMIFDVMHTTDGLIAYSESADLPRLVRQDRHQEQTMSRTSILALTAIAVLGTASLAARTASAWHLGAAGSAGSVVLDAMPIADAPGGNAGTRPAGTEAETQSCWRPGLSRNIGIAEQSCDVLTPAPQMPPKPAPPSPRR